MGDISRALKVRYPNLQQVFFSSRIYAGYATSNLNPEPYAYESGLAVKWIIEGQINQTNGGGVDPLAGDLDYASGVAPWLAWGPSLWANGLDPRSDGLIWEQTDFSSSDGTHPSVSGRENVGTMLMDFMLNSAFTQPWFLNRPPGDYDSDGGVDAADYVVWRKGLGGAFTADHYNLWRAEFGLSSGSGSGANSSARVSVPVPEPAALGLILFGVAGSFVVPLSRRRTQAERVFPLERFCKSGRLAQIYLYQPPRMTGPLIGQTPTSCRDFARNMGDRLAAFLI